MLAPRSNAVSVLSIAALSFGMLYVAAQPARADLLVDVQVGGNSIIGPIADGSANDTNASAGSISVNVAALNAALAAQGTPVVIDGFSATSNQPTNANTNTVGFLTQSGTAHYTSTTGGPELVSFIATDHDYTHPNLLGKTLLSSASATFTNVISGSQDAFKSFFNPSNTHFDQQIQAPASVLLPNLANNPSSASNTAAATPLGAQSIPFSLTDRSDLVLGPNTSSTLQARIQVTGTTQVTAVAPLPSPLAMIMCGLGLAGVAGHARARRRPGESLSRTCR